MPQVQVKKAREISGESGCKDKKKKFIGKTGVLEMEAVAEVRFIGGVFYKGVKMCNPGSFLILSSGWSALSGPDDLCGSAALAGVFVRGGGQIFRFDGFPRFANANLKERAGECEGSDFEEKRTKSNEKTRKSWSKRLKNSQNVENGGGGGKMLKKWYFCAAFCSRTAWAGAKIARLLLLHIEGQCTEQIAPITGFRVCFRE